jgi:hypothetical protein
LNSIRIGDVWRNPRGRDYRILQWLDGGFDALAWNEHWKKEEVVIWPLVVEEWTLVSRGDGEERFLGPKGTGSHGR